MTARRALVVAGVYVVCAVVRARRIDAHRRALTLAAVERFRALTSGRTGGDAQ
jgi:hypothetical protein